MKLGVKLIGGFGVVAVITLAVGFFGWTGITKLSSTLQGINSVHLPAVLHVYRIKEALTAIRLAQRTLMNTYLTPEERDRQYDNIDKARAKYQKEFEAYAALPHTADEMKSWQEFVTVVAEWKRENNIFLDSSTRLKQMDIPSPVELWGALEGCKGDHYKLMCRIVDAAAKKTVFEGGEDPTQCRFGQWLAVFQTQNPTINATLKKTAEAHVRFHQVCKTVKGHLQSGDVTRALAVFHQELMPMAEEVLAPLSVMIAEADKAKGLYKEMNHQSMVACRNKELQGLDHLDKISGDIVQKTNDQAKANANQATAVMLAGMGVGTVVSLLLGIFLSLSITHPIRRIIEELTSGAEQVAAAAGQVSSASQSAAQGASEQASSLEETSSALEEMASMTKTNADNAGKANDLMAQTTQVVGQSQGVMQQTPRPWARSTRPRSKIAKIIKVIEEIAFQTNLLALNAAVEAARAGRARQGLRGGGRRGAEPGPASAQAANETAQLISDTIERVKKGNELNTRAGPELRQGQRVGLPGRRAWSSRSPHASTDQAKGVDQINAAMTQMDKVVQQSAAGAEESATAVRGTVQPGPGPAADGRSIGGPRRRGTGSG